MWLPKWNTVIGSHNDTNIGFANVYGSPMASTLIDWSGSGYAGVNMETATTLAVAKYFNKKAIGLLNLSAHLIAGDTVFLATQKNENRSKVKQMRK
jgi:purine-nucleoside phosphorylase